MANPSISRCAQILHTGVNLECLHIYAIMPKLKPAHTSVARMRVRVIAVVLRVCVTLALKRQDCFDVRDRHQREAGKSAIGLNVADF